MGMQVALKVIEGKQTGTLIPLNREKFLIGREEDCQLRPNSDLVSRHHCVIAIDDFTVRIRDLGSTNGTFVNGQRITTQVVLKQNDQVRIGKLAFEMQIQIAAPPKPKAAAVEAVPEPVAIDYTQQNAPSGGDTVTELPVPPSLTDPNAIDGPTQMYSGDTTVIKPSAPAPATANAASAKSPRPVMAFNLPDPSEFNKPAAPAPAPVAAGAAAAPAAADSRNSAADIIRQYMQRRPT